MAYVFQFTMKKYYQLFLVIVCCVSVVSLLIYRHEYYRLRYVLEVLNFFGKPGLSEVEFCGPGFNATMLTELLHNTSVDTTESVPLFQQLDENFYSYSTYLRHYSKYDKLSQPEHYAYETDTIIVSKKNQEMKFGCHFWFENDEKPKLGKFSFKRPPPKRSNDEYELITFHCRMIRDLGPPIAVSFQKNTPNVDPYRTTIHNIVHVKTKKRPKEDSTSGIHFVSNLKLGACVVPKKVPLVSKSLMIEFLSFHQMMGVSNFIVYDSSLPIDITKRLKLLPNDLTEWSISFFPLNYPFSFAKTYNVVREAVEMDCIYRYMQVDKEVYNRISHVVVLSWDEFVVPRYHHNIKSLLTDIDRPKKVRRADISTLTFCTDQRNDPKVKPDYPDIIKKTHYYKLFPAEPMISIINLDSISSYEEIVPSYVGNEEFISVKIIKNQTIDIDVVAIHKYVDCSGVSTKVSKHDNNVPNSELEMKAHKFEGAMLKFAETLHSNKVYRLFKTGKIWEKSSPLPERDML